MKVANNIDLVNARLLNATGVSDASGNVTGPLTASTTTATAQTLSFSNVLNHYDHSTTGNTTFTLSGASAGRQLVLFVTIATAGHTLTFSGVTSWPGATSTAPAWATTVGTKYAISFVCNGANVHCTGFSPL